MAHNLHEKLASIVGDSNVLDDAATLSAYSRDYSPFPPNSPGVVVRPGTIDEVVGVLKLANSRKIPVVARGNGTSFTGFPRPEKGPIVLETRRMNRILDLDEASMVVRAQCGIMMSELEDQLKGRGLYVHTVSVPVRYTTLGGVLSGVVGGGLPPRISVEGPDGRHVVSLAVALPNGTVIRTGAGGSNIYRNADFLRGGNGPDLAGLFIGDGGMFGVKLEATLQIFPTRSLEELFGWKFTGFSSAFQALVKLSALSELPYYRVSFQAEENDQYSMNGTIDSESTTELDLRRKTIERICRGVGGKAIRDMKNFATESIRSDVFVKQTRGLLAFMSAKRDFPRIYEEVVSFLKREIVEGISLRIVFVPVMRNAIYTSISVRYHAESEEERKVVLEIVKTGYRKLLEMGCAPEPHQGYASKVAAAAWSPEYSDMIESIRRVVDPNGVMNPDLWRK